MLLAREGQGSVISNLTDKDGTILDMLHILISFNFDFEYKVSIYKEKLHGDFKFAFVNDVCIALYFPKCTKLAQNIPNRGVVSTMVHQSSTAKLDFLVYPSPFILSCCFF